MQFSIVENFPTQQNAESWKTVYGTSIIFASHYTSKTLEYQLLVLQCSKTKALISPFIMLKPTPELQRLTEWVDMYTYTHWERMWYTSLVVIPGLAWFMCLLLHSLTLCNTEIKPVRHHQLYLVTNVAIIGNCKIYWHYSGTPPIWMLQYNLPSALPLYIELQCLHLCALYIKNRATYRLYLCR